MSWKPCFICNCNLNVISLFISRLNFDFSQQFLVDSKGTPSLKIPVDFLLLQPSCSLATTPKNYFLFILFFLFYKKTQIHHRDTNFFLKKDHIYWNIGLECGLLIGIFQFLICKQGKCALICGLLLAKEHIPTFDSQFYLYARMYEHVQSQQAACKTPFFIYLTSSTAQSTKLVEIIGTSKLRYPRRGHITKLFLLVKIERK